MKSDSFRPDTGSAEGRILAIAALFDIEFSIDWIQELSNIKATIILNTMEKGCQEGVLKKNDIGIFSFEDRKTQNRLKEVLSAEEREGFHRKAADLMISEVPDREDAIMAAASQLIKVTNDREGCRLLIDAGNRYRRKGFSQKALSYYQKAIQDLWDTNDPRETALFIEGIIGISKERSSLSTPDKTILLLKEALSRASILKDRSLESILLLHLAMMEHNRTNYISAQEFFFKGRQIARSTNDPEAARNVSVYSAINDCYSGRFKEGVKKYEAIESIFSIKSTGYKLPLRVAITMGFAYAIVGQIPQALGMLNQLKNDASASKDKRAADMASIYIALVLIMKNDFSNAAAQLHITMKSSEQMDLFTKCLANFLQAHIYFEKKEFKKSHEYLKSVIRDRHKFSLIFRGMLFEFCLAMSQGTYPSIPGLSLDDEIRISISLGNLVNQGVAYRYKAICQQKKNEPSKEIHSSLKKSLELLEESGAQMEIGRTKEALALHHLHRNNAQKAKTYAQDAAEIFNIFGERQVSKKLSHLLKDFHIIKDLVKEILNIGPAVVKIRDKKKVAQYILSSAVKITDSERGGIFRVSKETDNKDVTLLTAKNLTAEDMERADFQKSIQMIRHSGDSGKSELETDVSSKNKDAHNSIKSRICIPFPMSGDTSGVLYFDNRFFKSKVKAKDLKILPYFGSFAAIAIDNAHAYEEIQSLNQRLNEEKNYLEEQQMEPHGSKGFVAASPAIKKVLTMVERVADTDTTVLILGDTGVGKEMVARAIHQQSSRKDKPFIRVNCSAFPEHLIASELFGHEKGSFTGAEKKRTGRFELADTGTLFLDEIGDISKDIQVRLLRVLQTKKFERVGASHSIKSDFRLITATNRNLEKAVAENRFRQDLYYRLDVFPIHIPPLKERMEDIAPLAFHFLEKYARKTSKKFDGIPKKEMKKLMNYHWPGNVRELENIIERGVILNNSGLFGIPELTNEYAKESHTGQMTLEEMEFRFISKILKKVNWRIYGPGGAAEILGLKPGTLYSKMKKLGIKNPDKQ